MAQKRDIPSKTSVDLQRLRNDPKVRMFLRQAAAIIATERGLSKASRGKLQALASRLELTDEQFRLAIDEMQQTVELPKALNRWERAFVTFLQREWQGFRGKVLSISVENRAVDLAGKKYQISEVRAQQLIQKTADELGIGRMTEGDAERFGERLIADAVGGQDALKPGQQEELQRLGERWGVSPEAVQQLVEQVLEDQRKKPADKMGGSWLLLLPAGMVLLGLLSVFLWQLGGKAGSEEKVSLPTVPWRVADSTLEPEQLPWWNEKLSRALAATASLPANTRRSDIQSADPEVRVKGMRELIEMAQESSPIHQNPESPRTSWNQLIALLYFYDPDPKVSHIVFQSIIDALQEGDSRQPPRMEAVFWAAQLLALMQDMDETIDSPQWLERMAAVREMAQAVVGPYPERDDSVDFFALAHQQISVDLWQRVIGQGEAGVKLDRSLVLQLKQQTSSVLAPEVLYQLELGLVQSLLERDETEWEIVQELIGSLVKGANTSQLAGWIDRLLAVKDRRFREFLATQLAARTGIELTTGSLDQIVERLSEYRFQRSRPAVEVWLEKNRQCESVVKRLEPWAVPQSAKEAQAIVDAVYATNVSLALMIELERRQDFGYLRELLSAGSPSLAQVFSPEGQPVNAPSNRLLAPSSAERRMKKEAIERLVTAAPDRVAVRISALESLAKLAKKFDDISYRDGQALIAYLLVDQELQESLAVERLIPQFSHWPTLHLALADVARQSPSVADRAGALYRLLQGESSIPVRPNDNERQDDVATLAVQLALEILESRGATSITQSDLAWERLQKIHKTMLMTRARILDHWADLSVWGGQDYQTALKRLVDQQLAPERRQWFDNALQIEGGTQPMARWIRMNQVLIELLRRQLDKASDSVVAQRDQVLHQYRKRMKQDIPLGRRLLLTEQALLQLASLALRQKIAPWQEE
ncbi:MAG: hypothetical protein VYE64_02385 [Planctomycetota bacterium]|nr:hypothetical protein [Planctomycetota bacterium]